MRNFKCLIALILLTLCLVPLSSAGEEVTKDGVIYIVNGDVPSQGIETLELTELWRVGGEDDDEFIFSSIEQVLQPKDNNIYILDGFSDLIYVFDLAGQLVRVIDFSGEIFRHGKNQIMTMFMKDDEIALLSKSPVKIICIDYFGLPGNRVDLPDNVSMVSHADWGNGNLIMGGFKLLGQQEVFLTSFSVYGEVQIDYVLSKIDVPLEEGNIRFSEKTEYFFLTKPWDIGFDGRVYIAPNWSTPEQGSYLMEMYGNDNKLEIVATRKFEAYKRSQAERDMQGPLMMGGYEAFDYYTQSDGVKYFEEDFEQDVLQIFAHPDGNIWVKTSRSTKNQPEGVMITYDVFSFEGYFIKQVSLLVDGDGEIDHVYFLAEDCIVVVKGQVEVVSPGVYPKADVLEIICYSVE